ncbi:MAG: response regulator, partial [Pseudorhodobacter sp.]|nr:response regulator [Pseudorhodobacter sp.]
PQKEYLRILTASGRLLMHHVNDVLTIARLDSGMSSCLSAPVDLQALVQEVLDNQTPAARGTDNVLRYHGPEDNRVTVTADSALLRQVLLNLVGNAVKFTQRGTITVRVQHLTPFGPTVISVSDTGIGIADVDLARIFDDFVTLDASYARHAAGTGLGLGIVKRIVDRLGGTLDVESQPGRGSTFGVTLPLVILHDVDPAAVPPQLPHGRAMTTLVVEDNAFNQLIIADMLRLEGHDVVVAGDGAEGIALATARQFDLILMDISMPRIDGLQAAEAIRQPQSASQHTPVIAMTAHALAADQLRFKAAGLQTTLVKPITRKALQAVLNGVAPPDPSATAPALVDVAVLHNMASDLGADRAGRLLDRFLAETGQSLADLAQRNPGPTGLRDLHRLEGSAAMFGAQALRQALSQMQQAWTGGATKDVAHDLADLQNLWQRTHRAYGEVGALPQLSSLR